MRGVTCDQEHSIVKAVASDEWTPQLQEHVEGCASCRDVVVVSRALRELAAASKPARLPPAAYVWWKSRLRRRRAVQRRVSRLISITQTATVAIAVIGLAVWSIWNWFEVSESIKTSLMSFSIWSSSSLASSGVLLVYLSLVLLLVNVLLTVRAVMTNHKSH
jgi:hypothetical protein